MKFVLTGAKGFIGSQLSCYFDKQGLGVIPLGRSSDAMAVLQGANVVVHLAARVHVMNDQSADPLSDFRRSNVDATVLLARQSANAGVRRFVYISSVKVNGESTKAGCPFTEQDIEGPQDAYGTSKWEAEQALRQIAQATGMELVIVRPPLVYGSGVKANFATLIHAVSKRWPMPLAAIHNSRSFVGVDNLVDFIHCCATHPNAANQTFLVSDGADVSTAQLIRELATVLNVRPNLWTVPQWMLELGGALFGKRAAVERVCGNLQVDISKARKLLDWRPPVSLQEGLRRAAEGVNNS
jgi:nucleoside-diphosphate-sugar epimerase